MERAEGLKSKGVMEKASRMGERGIVVEVVLIYEGGEQCIDSVEEN